MCRYHVLLRALSGGVWFWFKQCAHCIGIVLVASTLKHANQIDVGSFRTMSFFPPLQCLSPRAARVYYHAIVVIRGTVTCIIECYYTLLYTCR